MSFRSTLYLVKEGFKGLYRNRAMAFVAISSVVASLLILSLFIVVAVNINHLSKIIEQQVTMEIFVAEWATDLDVQKIEERIRTMDNVATYRYTSKEGALAELKELFGERSYLLEIYRDDNPLPRSFTIKPIDLEKVPYMEKTLASLKGIEEVRAAQDIALNISKSTYFIRIFMLLLVVVLTLVAIFIISNTIKLSVIARRKEIGIMKHIGATDAFINTPFFIEGMLLGFIGSGIAALLVYYGYGNLIGSANSEVFSIFSFYFVPIKDFQEDMISLLVALGVGIGTMGTVFSVKKFLKV